MDKGFVSGQFPGSIEERAIKPEMFPFEAFKFTKPSATNPYIQVKTGWAFTHPLKILSKSDDYTVTDDDGSCVLLMTTGADNKTVTLPTLADNIGVLLYCMKIDAGAGDFILDGEGDETINGSATLTLASQYDYAVLLGTETEWINFGA
jgi:hypothetical protein